MKHFILFPIIAVLLLLTGSNLRAQHPYIPIPEDSAFWISVEENWHEAEPGWQEHTFSYAIWYTDGKDTIVNGKRYFGYTGEIPPIQHYGDWSMHEEDWFRQDTIAKKVWKESGQPGSYEYLQYDFSLQKGDTITDTNQRIFYRWLPYKFWVANVDSIYFPNGTWHYRWFIKGNFGPDWGRPPAEVVQIEGMGYTTDFQQDPLYFYEPLIGYTYQITCFRHKSLWLYTAPNPWNADCDSMMVHYLGDLGIHESAKNELNLPLLYPNPATSGGMLNLNRFAGKTWKLYTITAYNSLGRLVLKKQLKPGQSFTLPYISPGLYFFIIKNSKQKTIWKQKISIQ